MEFSLINIFLVIFGISIIIWNGPVIRFLKVCGQSAHAFVSIKTLLLICFCDFLFMLKFRLIHIIIPMLQEMMMMITMMMVPLQKKNSLTELFQLILILFEYIFMSSCLNAAF
jgi:hypothetical protein